LKGYFVIIIVRHRMRILLKYRRDEVAAATMAIVDSGQYFKLKCAPRFNLPDLDLDLLLFPS